MIPKLKNMKFVVKKLETLLYRMVWHLFRYFEPRRHGSRASQMDGWTDRQTTDRQTERPLATVRSSSVITGALTIPSVRHKAAEHLGTW